MNPPKIPERISFLIPQKTQKAISENDRHVERQASKLSMMSCHSTTSEYLEEKYKACKYDLAASLARLGALQEAVKQGTIDQDEYNESSKPFFLYQIELLNEKKILSKQRRLLEADMDEELEPKRRKSGELDIEVIERAYANTIVPRVMGAIAKQGKGSFRQDRFKKAVLEAYNASEVNGGVSFAWCHVIHGWFESSLVKAAHLVPKSLSLAEIGHLFGVEEVPENFFYDWRLGITLHKTVEMGLDQGTIVIIPKPVENETRWECVLVDQSKRSDVVCGFGHDKIQWRDLDHHELQFRGESRPARRYLYFRFIITVLHAQRTGNEEFIEKLKEKENFWPSSGAYLQRATLISLARNISAFDLPSSLYESTTFSESFPGESSEDDAMMLTYDLHTAYTESTKRSHDDSDDDNEADDEMDLDA